jgi:hypothetical protein
MSLQIRDFKVMYLATMIGEVMQGQLISLSFEEEYFDNKNSFKNISIANMYLINNLISLFGGISNFTTNLDRTQISLYLIINEIIYDNFKDEKNIELEINKKIKIIDSELKIIQKKTNIKTMDYFILNSAKILNNTGNPNNYHSLIFLSVPFALKIKDKKDLIKSLEKFIHKYTDDINHVLACITCALFINYALNDIGINIWIDKLNEDLGGRDDSEKYIDYINNYIENNFRNGEFIIKAIDEFTIERNKNFINNYCSRNNRLLSEKPQEQVLLIYDTLLRSKENWEKIVLFGFCNWNDNPIISLVLGALYEILYKSTKINKNLLKRFSFNL